MKNRRDFLSSMGLATAAVAGDALLRSAIAQPSPAMEHAMQHAMAAGPWDMSWVDQIEKATYKAVFDSTNLSDGAAPDLASGILDNFKDAYGTDANVRMVIIMRQLGQVMAFNDLLWERYGIGEERKVNDPVTKQPAKRNPFATAAPGEPSYAVGSKLDALHARGAIFLVCNRASMNWAAGAAERMKRDVEEVRADVRSNLVPGAILMPTGVFALVRAQNAGCAYMRAS
jgi:intracellular sulfur oxidation DsrE/DsrF family protein